MMKSTFGKLSLGLDGLMWRGVLGVLLTAVMTLSGCMTSQSANQPTKQAATQQAPLPAAEASYQAGRYEDAYRQARTASRVTDDVDEARQAQYLMGLSAWRLNDRQLAARLLEQVADESPRQTAQERLFYGEVLAELGLIYSQMQDNAKAADRLMKAAPYLMGQDQANAYFYAGVALQKQDRQSEAVTQFRLAKAASSDAAFIAQVNQRLDFAGFTLQFGAFSSTENAEHLADQIAKQSQGMPFGLPRLVLAVDQRTGKTVTLVQLGLFTDYRSAIAAKNQIGEGSAIIVQRNGKVGR